MANQRSQNRQQDAELSEFHAYVRRNQQFLREPRSIANVLSTLLARRGYAQIQSAGELSEVWGQVAGVAVAQQSRVGTVRRGILQVVVQNSALLQELTFRKPQLLEALTRMLPARSIRDLKFRVGSTD